MIFAVSCPGVTDMQRIVLMHPNEIQIIYGHTLACPPHKISAGLAHREPSNRPWHGSTCVILGHSGEHERWKEWNLTRNVPAWSIFHWPASNECHTSKKPITLGIHHVEGFCDRSTQAREKGGPCCEQTSTEHGHFNKKCWPKIYWTKFGWKSRKLNNSRYINKQMKIIEQVTNRTKYNWTEELNKYCSIVHTIKS